MTFQIDDAITLLANTPCTLRWLLSDIPEGWDKANEGGDTWSPFDVMGHLIHGERTDWIPRARIILSDDFERRFEPFDRFAQFEVSRGRTLDDLVEEFEKLREGNVEALEDMDLGPEELARTGVHPELGEVTLSQLLATWVVHDLDHVAQISRVMSKQYSGDVGPWWEYLRILT
jgi:hypothetical protein